MGYLQRGLLGPIAEAEMPAIDAWPVGSVFLSLVDTSPATLLSGGTWVRIAEGKFLVGLDALDTAFDTAAETGGAKTHTHAGHANHVVTQPANHVVTQPANHVVTQPANHVVTQPADHTGVINHTHPLTDPGHVHDEYQNSATTGGLTGWGARDTSTNTASLTDYDTGSATTGMTVDNPAGGVAALAHSATAVDAHSATAVDAHSATAVDAHSATAVDAHSAHDTVSHLPPYFSLYMWQRTA